MTLLELKQVAVDVSVKGRPRRIVSDMSLSIDVGQALGVIGESGSGKSMTARMVLGDLPAGATVSGSVLFAREDVLSMTKRRLREYRGRDVAMVFQNPRAHINPVRTVGDFLTEGMRARGVGRRDAEQRAVKLLDDVRVVDAANVIRRYPHELSGGMLQRVMIASAVAAQPKLLIADEPTTALDVTTQAEVVAILDEMRRDRGMALLFITHDLDLATAICDRVVVAYAGRTIESQTAEAMQREPLHPYTAALLGARPHLSGNQRRLRALRGSPVSAWESPPGCMFAPRCDHVEEECREHEQLLAPVGDGLVACQRATELRKGV